MVPELQLVNVCVVEVEDPGDWRHRVQDLWQFAEAVVDEATKVVEVLDHAEVTVFVEVVHLPGQDPYRIKRVLTLQESLVQDPVHALVQRSVILPRIDFSGIVVQHEKLRVEVPIVGCAEDVVNVGVYEKRSDLGIVELSDPLAEEVSPLQSHLVIFLAKKHHPGLVGKLVVHGVRVDDVKVMHLPRQLRHVLHVVIKSFQVFLLVQFSLLLLPILISPQSVLVPLDRRQVFKFLDGATASVLGSEGAIGFEHVFGVENAGSETSGLSSARSGPLLLGSLLSFIFLLQGLVLDFKVFILDPRHNRRYEHQNVPH
jgi:hypothetical protein